MKNGVLKQPQGKVLTLELLVKFASWCDWKGTYEFLEINSSILILIKYVEDIVCEFSRVTEWEELFIDFSELCFVQLAGWTVFEESLVPIMVSFLNKEEK